MSSLYASLSDKRGIIDRRMLADRLFALEGTPAQRRAGSAAILKQALGDGRAAIERRLRSRPAAGREATRAYSYLTDQILRLAIDLTTRALFPQNNPTTSERIAIAAVGGYGRAEMAPASDVDVAFLIPWKPTSWTEQVVETMLYLLWDLGLKVGHSTRSIDETIRAAKGDLTVRTALLEARYVWGDEALYDEAQRRFRAEVVQGAGRAFVADKLAEREARHTRMGNSRYVVEPNLKEGKGGLRDLHTLFWIGKHLYQADSVDELAARGLFTGEELLRFQKAENFLLAVRCHLHLVHGRADDRLTFDVQPEIARRMRYQDRPGRSAVERFMRHYFLTAKQVGDLTGLFLTHLEETQTAKPARFSLSGWMRRPRALAGFVLDQGRLALPHDAFFHDDPVRLIEMFAVADEHDLDIHPQAMRAAQRDARLIDGKVRSDKRANALFLRVLASTRDPETPLRAMNDATVFGRFVPDFGRIVAQSQFDMYHHYTVDEHSIRAIGLASRIERGLLREDHPLATRLMQELASRRTLYVAVLLHDIAKGRAGDHSILGAEVAQRLCPRLGLSPAETETVAWLVRWHLLLSDTAMKRDLSDPKTIEDFAQKVQSIERLRLLTVLTIVDIRAVGPGVWNGWKRQLIADLYDAAVEHLRLGFQSRGRAQLVAAKHDALAAAPDIAANVVEGMRRRLPDSYWVAEPDDIIAANARLIDAARHGTTAVDATVYPSRGATLVTIYTDDHPGLFARMAGAIHLAGASIIDARIHTTRDGQALDNFLVQDPHGRMFADRGQLERLERAIAAALDSPRAMVDKLVAKQPAHPRADAFSIAPNVIFDNHASNQFTVVEVNARDRPALLNALAYALYAAGVAIRSARIATYGERAVDTFYVTDLTGQKIVSPERLAMIEGRLLGAAQDSAKAA